jgi:hypothetical protein
MPNLYDKDSGISVFNELRSSMFGLLADDDDVSAKNVSNQRTAAPIRHLFYRLQKENILKSLKTLVGAVGLEPTAR